MNNKIKIIFLGYDYFGGQFLQVLLNHYSDKFEVVAASTNSEQRNETFSKKYKQAKNLFKKSLLFTELKEKIFFGKLINGKLLHNRPPSYQDITTMQLAEKHGIPLISPNVIFNGDAATLDSYGADYIVIASFGKVPSSIYNSKQTKVINFHPSFLPQLRGGSPVYTAIMRGQLQTGFSFHHLSDVFDAGPLLYQEFFEINPNNSCRQAEMEITAAGAHKLYDLIMGLQSNSIAPIDISGREITKCFKNYEISLLLEPLQHTTANMLKKISASSSWALGAAFIRKGFRHIYITEAKAAQWDSSVIGQSIVYKEPEGLLIKTKDGAILVTQAYYKQKYYSGRELAQFKRVLFDVVKR
jgi:methionyl-tRNA formyltransferase